MAFEKLQQYCAYQDRSTFEAEEKLKQLGLTDAEDRAEVLFHLNRAGFLDDERFARSYVRGKFRLKNWGRLKIKHGLKLHRLSEYCIATGFEEIDEEGYLATLEHLAQHKWDQTKVTDVWIKKKKVGSYLMGKGYETDLITNVLGRLTQV